MALPDKPHRCHTDAGIGAARRRLRNMGLPAHIAREQRSDSLPQLQARSLAHYPTSATVAVGMAVTGHRPHRPVLAGTAAHGSYLGCAPWQRRICIPARVEEGLQVVSPRAFAHIMRGVWYTVN